MTRVCHLSSGHRGLDTRIFHKECVSLAAAGFDSHLVIIASPDEVRIAADQGVTLHPLKKPRNRFSRMALQAWRCYAIGRGLKADIYHFHDPELIPYGILLAFFGKTVIYDVHEDVPQDILTKDWIAPWIRKTVSGVMSALEYFGARYFFAIAGATPFIAQRFKKITPRSVDINNYPMLGELSSGPVDWTRKQNQICYVGGIARVRGNLEIMQALGLTQSRVRLQLAGISLDPEFEAQLKAQPGWSKVDALGWLDRAGVKAVLERSVAGLVTLLPITNYIDALPVKMFEYMAAGVPVIASNFPLWREIIEGNGCGICVDPLDPAAIARAIDYLVTHPKEAEQMGLNGQRAVQEKYNWSIEKAKLLQFYADLGVTP